MSQISTSMLLTGDSRDLVAAANRSDKAMRDLVDMVTGVSRVFGSASASASAFEVALKDDKRASDQLRASLDPVFASTKRLETGQKTLTSALRSGAITTAQYESAQELLQLQHRQTTAAMAAQARTIGGLTTVTRGGAGGMQNFSYQLQDVFTQVGMGVPLMISLGQQAPQILSGFGTMGAVFGVVAAAGFPLAAMFFDMGYGARDVTDAIDVFKESLGGLEDYVELAKKPLMEVRQEYGFLAEEVIHAARQVALFEAQTGFRSLVDETQEIGQNISDAARQFERLQRVRQQHAAGTVSTEQLRTREEVFALFNDELELTGEQLQNLDQMLETFRGAQTMDEMARASFDVTKYLDQQYASLLDMPPVIASMYAQYAEFGTETARGNELLKDAVHASNDLGSSISAISFANPISGANTLLGSLQASLGVAGQILAAMGQSALANLDAEDRLYLQDVEIKNRGAGASETDIAGMIAGETRRLELEAAGVPTAIIQQQAAEARRLAQAQAENAETIAAQHAAQRAANQPPSTSGGGGGGAKQLRAGERERQSVIDDIARQMDQLAPSYARDVAELEEWREEALRQLNPAREGYEAFAADVEFIFAERLAEAYREDLENRTDWAAGVERSLLDMNDSMLSWADLSSSIFTEWSEGLEDAFVELGMTGKTSVEDLIDFTLEQFLRLAYQKAVQPAVSGIFDMLASSVSSLIPGAQSHTGSIVGSSSVQKSISSLSANERLTVTTVGQRVFTPDQINNGAMVVDALAAAAANSGGGQTNVQFAPSIIIENNSAAVISGEVREESDGQGGRNFRIVLAEQVGNAMSLPGGGARQTLQRGYGLRPVGARR